MKKKLWVLIPVMIATIVSLFLFLTQEPVKHQHSATVDGVPAFSGEPYVTINNNQPEFSDEDITTEAYEFYSDLDSLNRCGYAMACIGVEIMPTEERGEIGQIKPSGWHTIKYDFIDGKYLYNRCHLIGYQLAGENANEKNLITGTRYMNVVGMLPFENMVDDYIETTGNHVLYRVTPVYDGDNLVARGVQMEAYSVEDQGAGICFNVYVYNNQPGVTIDYATGESWIEEGQNTEPDQNYVLNTNSKKFHKPDCDHVESIKDENKENYTGTRATLIQQGYEPCGGCCP